MNSMAKWRNKLRGILTPFTNSIFAIIIGIIAGGIILWINGYPPLKSYYYLFHDSLFTKYGLLRSFSYAIPLILTALTWSIGMRVGIYNIGAEGQLIIGAGATVAASTFILPTGIHLGVAMIFAMAAGMAWSLPAALLKIKRGVHEVVSTIMLNWIAIYFVRYLVDEPLSDPEAAHGSIPIAESSRFPILFEGSILTGAIFVSIAFAIIMYIILWHTKTGQHLRAAGLSKEIARNSGINVARMTIISFLLGGAAAGLAGCTLTAGMPPEWTIYRTLATLLGFGFTGIGVGMIGRNHPIGGIFAAVFFGSLWSGSYFLQLNLQIPIEITDILTGVIIIFVAIPALIEMIRKRR